MKRISIILFILTIVGQLIFPSCRKPYPACDVENPLKDLPWLIDMIDRFEKDAKEGYPVYAKIYQCTYSEGKGFLLELCVGCPDFGLQLTNCEGEILCTLFGYDGGNCPMYNVDLENKKLIWKKKTSNAK